MNRPKICTLLFCLLFSSANVFSQDFQKQFNQLWKDRDTLALKAMLSEWEKKQPKDAELFVCYYNYYVYKSKNSFVTIGREPKGNDALKLNDTGTGKTVGYMYENVDYNDEDMKKGFEYIDRGIALHPDRLDMRLGKIYMLGELEKYNALTREIIATLNYSDKNKNKWLWSNNEPKDNAEDFMLGSIQHYIGQLYEVGDSEADNIRHISEVVLQYHPKNVESITNIATCYIINNDYKKAIEYLKKAEAIDPKDCIVMGNIAYVYAHDSEKQKAIEYYQKILNICTDKESKNIAEKELNRLLKN